MRYTSHFFEPYLPKPPRGVKSWNIDELLQDARELAKVNHKSIARNLERVMDRELVLPARDLGGRYLPSDHGAAIAQLARYLPPIRTKETYTVNWEGRPYHYYEHFLPPRIDRLQDYIPKIKILSLAQVEMQFKVKGKKGFQYRSCPLSSDILRAIDLSMETIEAYKKRGYKLTAIRIYTRNEMGKLRGE